MLSLKTTNINKTIPILPSHIEWEVLDKYSKNHFISIGNTDDNALISYTFEEVDRIPFEHYYHFFRLLKILKDFQGITEILSYGSLGSEKFNANSDIDLFLITEHPIDTLVLLIQKVMPDCYSEHDSIKIWNGNLLIECTCIQSIAEAKKYIPESPYVSAEKRIFLARNFNDCVNQLEQISQIKANKADLIEVSKKKLYHNVRKLSKYKNDRCRFRFHCQIIEHCIIRLRAIINGDLKHNYLPRNAINYINAEEWQLINYTVFDDPQEFINQITPLTMKILDELEEGK